MNSFMSWVGGKRSLRDKILIRFPLDYERYIEVFGGAGWILFHKPPDAFEVFNDANSNLVNLYRCVRDKPNKLKNRLQYVLNSRADFDIICEKWLEAWTRQFDVVPLGQEIDPITGDATPCSPWYSSGMLSYLYAAHRLGIQSI